jgi:two-component system response regulator MprA
VTASRCGQRRRGRRRSAASAPTRPTCWCSTSACPTPTGATSARRCAPAASLFLTARDALTDRLSGFHVGGDDYLVKPFALAELLVRVRSLVRRGGADGTTRAPSGLLLDPAGHAASFGEREITLTPTEFRLLAALAAQPSTVVRRATLIATGWPEGAVVHDNTLDAYLARIRRKLREIGATEVIETSRGVGYRLR